MMEKWKVGGMDERMAAWSRLFRLPSVFRYSTIPTFQDSNSRFGFSILEVLVALAVFAIAAGGMLATLGNHLRDVSHLKDQARAVRIAKREMDALQRLTSFELLEETGEEGRFSWVSRIADEGFDELPGEEFADDAASDEEVLALLQIEVFWSEIEGGDPSKRVRLESLYSFPEG